MANNRKDAGNLTWAKAFDDFNISNGNMPEGEGWYTMEELRKKLGVGICRMHLFLREGAEKGQIEVWDGSKIGKNGRLVRSVWYRLK